MSHDDDYLPPQVGDRWNGMEWTGEAWTAICLACDVALTEYNAAGELSCPQCGRSYIQLVRGQR